jgi:hypothetical protein
MTSISTEELARNFMKFGDAYDEPYRIVHEDGRWHVLDKDDEGFSFGNEAQAMAYYDLEMNNDWSLWNARGWTL